VGDYATAMNGDHVVRNAAIKAYSLQAWHTTCCWKQLRLQKRIHDSFTLWPKAFTS